MTTEKMNADDTRKRALESFLSGQSPPTDDEDMEAMLVQVHLLNLDAPR